MASYEIDEARMSVPDGWEDRTVNSLEYDDAPGVLKVIMSRHRRGDRTLERMTEDVLVDMRRRVAGFELVNKRAIELDGESALEVHIRFRDGALDVDQRSFWFVVGGKCVTLGVVHSRPLEGEGGRSAEAAKLFEQIRETIRIRPPEEQDIAPPTPIGPTFGGG